MPENKGIINDLILRFSEANDKTAFCIYNGTETKNISYQQLTNDILHTAGFFVRNAIIHQHIAIAAPNNYDTFVALSAVIASGNIAVMLNQDLPYDILLSQCDKADISIILADPDFASASKNVFGSRKCISISELKYQTPISLNEIACVTEEDTIIMLFTSGTTGQSKAVETTSRSWRCALSGLDQQYDIEGMDRIYSPLPFYHIVGLMHTIETLYFHKVVCIGRGIKYLFMDLPVLQPSMLNSVPLILESLSKLLRRVRSEEEQKKVIGSNLKAISFAGASLKEPVLRFLLEKGFIMMVNYGMTEIPMSTWCIIDSKEHFLSAGKFTEYTQYRLQDQELILKSPALMKGYYKDPETTAQVVKDGWIHTGDLGRCDENGYFYLTGRKKNVIILSNGENVNPEEIEGKFGLCPDVVECLVYGDEKGICADIYTHNPDAVKHFIRDYNQSTPLYRQVYKVNYLSTPLEKTGSGKIKRKENK